MRLKFPSGLPGLALVALLASAAAAGAVELREISEVDAIETYRVEARFLIGEDPPIQTVEVTGAFGKHPSRHEQTISVAERSREPHLILSRKVDGQLYVKPAGKWAAVEKLRYDEMIVLSPGQLLGIEKRTEDLGLETVAGRELRHLRGDKDDLHAVCGGETEIDFSRVDNAVIDLWIDDAERYIVKFHVTGAAAMGKDRMPFDFRYEYLDLNAPVVVQAPAMPTQEEVDAKLGFTFPLPEGAQVAIYGASVVIVTDLPLDAARSYSADAMTAAGFTAGDKQENSPGEFRVDYAKSERRVSILVFQVSERGATIRVDSIR